MTIKCFKHFVNIAIHFRIKKVTSKFPKDLNLGQIYVWNSSGLFKVKFTWFTVYVNSIPCKSLHVWTTYPPFLVNIFFEWPLIKIIQKTSFCNRNCPIIKNSLDQFASITSHNLLLWPTFDMLGVRVRMELKSWGKYCTKLKRISIQYSSVSWRKHQHSHIHQGKIRKYV